MKKYYDVIVVGGGHSGIEASLVVSRLGLKCLLITQHISTIGRLSCNPAIGGLAKGHIVKEIDALGGLMGRASDASCIQFKTLNTSKGRAVWSPRAQVDKLKYQLFVQSALLENNNIDILSDEVVDIIVNNNTLSGIKTINGNVYECSATIITTGTFLSGLIHIGTSTYPAGRMGELPSCHLSSKLEMLGFERNRLKTGTPPRILASSVDYSLLEKSLGDDRPGNFSLFSKNSHRTLSEPCFLTYTNNFVHKYLEDNLKLSAMYSGRISGIGPRYCPSIEDKIVRFSGRDRHHLFLEPEWKGSDQLYVNGFSTSMPENIQLEALRKIPALKDVKLVRPGYAIEYDYFPARQLKNTLETKQISGLYFAGQLNGTSGYEEAAAQGLVAGINSVHKILGKKEMCLERYESYIGVLIDDLITKHIDEPYRMFTSRAEHRLNLRPDNVYRRLGDVAIKNNLLDDNQRRVVVEHNSNFKTLFNIVDNSSVLWEGSRHRAVDLLKRPGVCLNNSAFCKIETSSFNEETVFEVETEIKYSGYVNIERNRIRKQIGLSKNKIPKNFDYSLIKGLSSESVEKLSKVKPQTLAQAGSIGGIRPSDIVIISVFIKSTSDVSCET